MIINYIDIYNDFNRYENKFSSIKRIYKYGSLALHCRMHQHYVEARSRKHEKALSKVYGECIYYCRQHFSAHSIHLVDYFDGANTNATLDGA